jgi:hypothetical protein
VAAPARLVVAVLPADTALDARRPGTRARAVARVGVIQPSIQRLRAFFARLAGVVADLGVIGPDEVCRTRTPVQDARHAGYVGRRTVAAAAGLVVAVRESSAVADATSTGALARARARAIGQTFCAK